MEPSAHFLPHFLGCQWCKRKRHWKSSGICDSLKRKVGKKGTMLNQMATKEVSFTKKLNGFDKASGERSRRSDTGADIIQLRSAERGPLTTAKDFCSKTFYRNKIIGATQVRWTPPVSFKKHETHKNLSRHEDESDSVCESDDLDALLYTLKHS